MEIKHLRAVRLHQARTLALIHRFYIFEICSFLTLRITADAEGYRDGGPLLLLHCEVGFIGDALSASEDGTHSRQTLVLVLPSWLWLCPLVCSLVRTLRGLKVP